MSLRDKTMTAMAGVGAASLASKVLALASTLVVGFLVTEEQMAVFATAAAVVNVMMFATNGGAKTLLVREGDNFEKALSSYYAYALMFNAVSVAAIFVLTPIVCEFYAYPSLASVILLMGLSALVQTYIMVYHAKLSIDGRFSAFAWIVLASNLMRAVVTVILALLGFGALSLAAAHVAAFVAEAWVGRSMCNVRGLPAPRINKEAFTTIFRGAKWLMLTQLAYMAAIQGELVVLGLFVPAAVVGVYFFGLQAATSVNSVMTVGFSNILMPAFSKINASNERQNSAFATAVEVMTVVVAVVAGAMVLVMPAVFSFLWGDKWQGAGLVVQLVCVSLVPRLVLPVVKSILEAKGKWSELTWIYVADALGVVAASVMGGIAGSLEAVAGILAGYRFVSAALFVVITFKWLGISPLRYVGMLAKGVLITVGIPVTAVLLAGFVEVTSSHAAVWAVVMFAATVPVVVRLLFRKVFVSFAFQVRNRLAVQFVSRKV
jgi:O-antigen/teichoic acid export membrane protein